MFKRYRGFIQKISRLWVFYFLFSLILAFNFFVFPDFFRRSMAPPDVRIFYSTNYLNDYLKSLPADYRVKQLIFYWTCDFIYPLIYTVFLSIVYIMLLPKVRLKSSKAEIFVFFPLIIWIFDMIENTILTLLIIDVSKGNSLYSILLKVAPFVTTLKWVSVLVNIVIILFLLIRLSFVRNKRVE